MRTTLGILGTMVLASTVQAQSLSAGAAGYVDAVNGLTLEAAIAEALEREPSLRAARAEIEAAAGLERQARLRANPTVTTERQQGPDGMLADTMITVQWPLELFRRGPRTDAARQEREAAASQAADRERLLAAEVRARYGELLVALRTLELLDQVVAVVSEQHALVAARVEQGAAPALDRDLLDVELRRWRADHLVAQGRMEAAIAALNRVRGLPPDVPLQVRYRLADVVERDPAIDASTAPAVAARADVRAAAAAVRANEAARDAARASGQLDVSVMGGYARMESGFMQQGLGPDGRPEPIRNRMNAWSAGVMVMLPLFDRNQGNLAAAAARHTAAEATLQAVTLDARAEAAAAASLDRRAREALDLFAGGARAQAAQNLEVVRQTYALGRATVFDVLAEQRRYLEFEQAYTDALRLAYEARTALLSARGDMQ